MPRTKGSKPRAEFYYDPKRKQYRKRTPDGDVWADTKAELRAKLDAISAQKAAGLVLNDKTVFADFTARWLPAVTAGLTAAGANDYHNALNVWLLPRFGDRRLRDIKPIEIDELMLALNGKSRSTQKTVLRVMRRVMASAAENGLILRNPTDGKRAGGDPPAEKEPLTDLQQAALLSALDGTRALPFVALCLYAGLRREEALGLHWMDVHLDVPAPYLDVRHVVRYDKAGLPILSDKLKSRAARRTIPIPSQLTDILRAERKRPRTISSVLVVPAADGSPCSESSFRSIWASVRRRKKDDTEIDKHTPIMFRVDRSLDFDVAPHQLRHTYITKLCASRLDIKKIQYLAGHADPSITLRIYAHVVGAAPSDISAQIEQAFSAGSGSASGSDPQKFPNVYKSAVGDDPRST